MCTVWHAKSFLSDTESNDIGLWKSFVSHTHFVQPNINQSEPGDCCNIGHPYVIQLKLNSREISLDFNIFLSCRLNFCTEPGSITAVLCEKFK